MLNHRIKLFIGYKIDQLTCSILRPEKLDRKIALSATQATDSLEGSGDNYLVASYSYYGYTPTEFTAIVNQTGIIPLKKKLDGGQLYVNNEPVTISDGVSTKPFHAVSHHGFRAIGAESESGNKVIIQRSGIRYKIAATSTWQIGAIFQSLQNENLVTLNESHRSTQEVFEVRPVSGGYLIGGVKNPELVVLRGSTYIFDLQIPGHPFHLQTSGPGFSSTNSFTTGFSGSGKTTGRFAWTVPAGAPDQLYYQCQFHRAMHGLITVLESI